MSGPRRPRRFVAASRTGLVMVAAMAAVVLAACGRESSGSQTRAAGTATGKETGAAARTAPERPPVPAVERIDALAHFAAAEQAAPPPLSEERAAALNDLVETAWLPDYASPRLAKLAAESMFDEAGIERALEDGLDHDHPTVRAQCAWNLARLGVVESLPRLIRRLRKDTDPHAQLWIADAMWRLGSDAGLPFYPTWFAIPAVAEEAGRSAIARIQLAGDDLPESPSWGDLDAALLGIHDHWRLHGTQKRVPVEHEAGDGAVGAAARVDAESATNPALRGRLAHLLRQLPNFQLREVDVARAVMRSLGRMGVPLLREALKAEDRYVRFHSLEMVHALGPCVPDLGPEVLALLTDPVCHALALQTLGRMGFAEGYQHMIARIDDPDLEIAVAALSGLGGLGNPDAVAPLEEVVRDADRSMDARVHAAASLAMLVVPAPGDEEAADPGLTFLQEQIDTGTYHEPTVRELIDEVEAQRRLIALRG